MCETICEYLYLFLSYVVRWFVQAVIWFLYIGIVVEFFKSGGFRADLTIIYILTIIIHCGYIYYHLQSDVYKWVKKNPKSNISDYVTKILNKFPSIRFEAYNTIKTTTTKRKGEIIRYANGHVADYTRTTKTHDYRDEFVDSNTFQFSNFTNEGLVIDKDFFESFKKPFITLKLQFEVLFDEETQRMYSDRRQRFISKNSKCNFREDIYLFFENEGKYININDGFTHTESFKIQKNANCFCSPKLYLLLVIIPVVEVYNIILAFQFDTYKCSLKKICNNSVRVITHVKSDDNNIQLPINVNINEKEDELKTNLI
jgi:hypothetical protein